MASVCSVARVAELEAENAELRKLVTEERITVASLSDQNKHLAARNGQLHEELQRLRAKEAPSQGARPKRRSPRSVS